MKQITLLPLSSGLIGSMVMAGSISLDPMSPATSSTSEAFAQARRPISNPTLFDLALPGTNLHPIYIHHRLPDRMTLVGGAEAPLGGEVEVYALQFEFAVNERMSIVATKDGYIDMDFDQTLQDKNGFANLGAGLKYAFILDPTSHTALSGTMTVELPTGDSNVLQGEGDGAVNLILNGLKLADAWQFAGSSGLQVPISDEQSTLSFVSAHVSYETCPWFIPLLELNWFHVLDAGDGRGNYPQNLAGALPGVLTFEGGDVFNIGAVNSTDNRDQVTAAVGFRSRLADQVDVGAVYEFPLTNDEESLMQDRITLDLLWKF